MACNRLNTRLRVGHVTSKIQFQPFSFFSQSREQNTEFACEHTPLDNNTLRASTRVYAPSISWHAKRGRRLKLMVKQSDPGCYDPNPVTDIRTSLQVEDKSLPNTYAPVDVET